MTDRNERAVLNHLIETCKDAERGFRHVAGHATNPAVRSLFLDIASERGRFANQLLPHFSLSVYQDALEGMLPPTVRGLVQSQYHAVQETGERLRALETAVK